MGINLHGAPPSGPALPLAYLKPLSEPPGPSSRRSAIVLSEVMYRPAVRPDGRNVQFIEVFNSEVFFEDLSGWSLRGDVEYTFPANAILAARSHFVVAASPADLRAAYPGLTVAGASPVFGPFSGGKGLSKGAGTLRLHNRAGAVVFELEYRDDSRWPVAANGGGHSLSLARPSYGERNPYAWGPSEQSGGSPGSPEPTRTHSPLDAIVINELLAHSELPARDFVELYNYSEEPVDLSGCILTDDLATNRFIMPTGTRIAPRGHVAWDANTLGFALNAAGESLFLFASNRVRVLDAVTFEAQENGVAWGRQPDGAARFCRLQTPTPEQPNAAPLAPAVVLNEIMYHPASELDGDQYVELHNPGATAVDLSGWRLGDGIRFAFPTGATIPPEGYVVVARSLSSLVENYPGYNPQYWFGDFSGSLSGAGERLTLSKPVYTTQTGPSGVQTTNLLDVVVDEVTYGTGGRWGRWADGGGSSLERRDARTDGRFASNWADSDESRKSPWVDLRVTGPADLGNTAADALQILSHGAGEYLIDDVVVQVGSGTNRVINSTFDAGTAGWSFQGNHLDSAWEPLEGATAPGCLHLRANGAGTTGPNRAFTRIAAVTRGGSVTLRARVRWLRGAPALLVRLKGNYVEIPGIALAARNLGTPGAPNSTRRAQSVPQISEVTHFPVLPRASEIVRITARIDDPAGLESVVVRYHADGSADFNELTLTNSGAGWFSAELPPLTGFQQFHLVATNRLGLATAFPDNAPARECNIRYGDPLQSGALGQYRLWVSKTNVSRWTTRHKLANAPLDTTFVYGDTRAIYNAGSQYSGSPYHAPSYNTPTGNKCDYVVVLPPDDAFLGETELNLLQPGNGGEDVTGQAEQHSYWIARELGLPSCHRRPILVWFNGVKRGVVYEDAQQPNGDFVKEWYPNDAQGDLRKIQLWFEFEADGATFNPVGATLENFVSQGRKKLARYRWNWPRRSYGNDPNNFTNLFSLVDAVNTRETGERYSRVLEQATDVDQWYRTHVVEHIVGNNDSYSYGGGQNMYAYKPERGPWQLLIWDIDFAFLSALPTSDMVGIGGASVGPVNTHPPFTRKYYQAMIDAVQGPMDTNKFSAILDARYNGMRTNGATSVGSAANIKNFLRTRRDYMIKQINSFSAPLALSASLTNGITSGSNLVTLSGTAPLDARALTVNGRVIPVTWTTRTAWTARVPFDTGTHLVLLSGLNGRGQPLTNPPVMVEVTVTAAAESPVGKVRISEIFPHAVGELAATWIELNNTSPSTAYNLSGWRLEGLDYVMPPGTVLAAGGRLIIPSSRHLFGQTYGPQLPVSGEFSGRLDPDGETLRLIQPGTTEEPDRIVDELRYDVRVPWPDILPGASLQLIDSAQDNRRAANWLTAALEPSGAAVVGLPATPGAVNTGAHPLPSLPALALNELMPLNTATLRDNLGRYRPWLELHNDAATDQPLTDCFLSPTPTNLAAWRFPAGASVPAHGFLIVWLDGDTAASTDAAPHAGFSADASGTVILSHLLEGRVGALDVLKYESPGEDRAVGDLPDGDLLRRHVLATPTPNRPNTAAAPAIRVFINEWLADNTSVLTDPADGDPEDWFELYNAGASAVNLTGYHLSNSRENPARFRIPDGYRLPPGGHLLVWADGESAQNQAGRTDLHVDFKLSKAGDTIVFAGLQGEILDAVTFGGQTRNISQGREPDGGSAIGFFATPSPGTVNPLPAAPARIDAAELLPDEVNLHFIGAANRRYELQFRITINLSEGEWGSVETLRANDQGRGAFRVPRLPGDGARFFRIRGLPGDF